MKITNTFLLSLLSATLHATAEVHYVNVASSSPASPYTNWATAAVTIQDAVDVAVRGETVLVAPGVYEVGGRLVPGNPVTNRVAVTKPINLESTDGPVGTVIRGIQVPQTTNGESAARGVYLADGAVLSGFTVTSGATCTNTEVGYGGGVLCESDKATVLNCVVTENSAVHGGGASGGTWQACVLGNNSSIQGGGIVGGNLIGCLLTNNIGDTGGGADGSTLTGCSIWGNSGGVGGGMHGGFAQDCSFYTNTALSGGGGYETTMLRCALKGNSAVYFGGGAYLSSASGGWLSHCTLEANTAQYGGGLFGGRGYRCSFIRNVANDPYGYGTVGYGGGTHGGKLSNCIMVGNSANYGGGASTATLNHCTIVQNTAGNGGGVFSAGSMPVLTANNCIIYYNIGFFDGTDNCTLSNIDLNYCCITNTLGSEIGSHTVSSPPLFVSLEGGDLRLDTNSPCIDRGGNHLITSLTDIEDNARTVGEVVDIGAYEFQSPQLVALPRIEIADWGSATVVTWPLSASGYILECSANLAGGNWSSIVDGVSVTNGVVSWGTGTGEPSGYYRLRNIKPN